MGETTTSKGAFVPLLPAERRASGAGSKWLFTGQRLDSDEQAHGRTHPWYMVLWLTGVDYFSTLGYQPGIALLAAGALSPIATALLVGVTLFCALPMYCIVARRSFVGLGSIAMLENLLSGWRGKVLVLVLLGFAATGFIITMTLSAADAALHAVENPWLHPILGDHRMAVTVALLALLAYVFVRGFTEAIGLAALVAVPYLLLTSVTLVRALMEVVSHPELIPQWRDALSLRGDWTSVLIASAFIFPKLALGLSGFETGVSVMPLIKGDPQDAASPVPEGRVRNTRKLLAAAALIMSVMLILSSFVTTLLIPETAWRPGGEASGRAIAWLSHHLLGPLYGSIYDASTILILWFAGASAMVGLLHLIPRYLPRFGMAPGWVVYPRPLIFVILLLTIIVTIAFRAEVESQGGAYATGVLGLMLSGAIAAALSLWRERFRALSVYCWGVAAIFAYALIGNVVERPDGIIIAGIFVVGTMVVSGISRLSRATELRVSGVTFCDDESAELWSELINKRVHLVPVRTATHEMRQRKLEEIHKHYALRGSFAFVNVQLIDNRSEFFAPLQVKARREGECYVIEVSQAIAIANTIAYVSELIDPISIFLGLTRKDLVTQALKYLLLGEGETGLMVYTILLRYWEHTPEEDVRPLIFMMSD